VKADITVVAVEQVELILDMNAVLVLGFAITHYSAGSPLIQTAAKDRPLSDLRSRAPVVLLTS
jgi:hypothetical protein